MEGLIKDVNSIMELQLYLQIAIPSGYLAYLLARLGIRQHDRATDIVFLSLSFSLVSVMAWYLLDGVLPETFQMSIAIIAPLFGALLWRKCLHSWTLSLLNKGNIANATQFPNTWIEIIESTKVGVAQVVVYLKSGEALVCDYIYSFKDAPISLLRWDTGGNIALYVTKRKPKDSDDFIPVTESPMDEVDDIKFYRLTYVPKDSIETIEIVINKPIS